MSLTAAPPGSQIKSALAGAEQEVSVPEAEITFLPSPLPAPKLFNPMLSASVLPPAGSTDGGFLLSSCLHKVSGTSD